MNYAQPLIVKSYLRSLPRHINGNEKIDALTYFAEGAAKCGDSASVTNSQTYETCDVGVLSNNIEKTFGLSSLKDKLLFLAPEIKGDLKLEQSEFQLLIEGGDMQLPVKYM